jgi:hypothetical protein
MQHALYVRIMSQSAKQAPPPPLRDANGTGRFRIDQDRRSDTMLPPGGGHGDLVSLETLGGVLEIEPDALGQETVTGPRGSASGVFVSEPRDGLADGQVADAGLAELVTSLAPYYRGDEGRSERAELEIEDFSLRLDNPYLASSLLPPPRKPVAVRKVMLGGVVITAVALLAAGLGAWLAQRPHAVASRQRIVAAKVQATSASVELPAARASVVAAISVPQSPTPVPAAASIAVPQSPAVLAAAAIRPAVPVVQKPVPAPVAAVAASVHGDAAKTAPVGHSENVTLALPAAPVAVPASSATAEPIAPVAVPASIPLAADEIGALPEAPTRQDVVTAFEQVRADLSQCAAGKHGIVVIDAGIANSGRVARAVIDGAFKGTPEGSCMARAARGAHFPRFSQPTLNVSYPISL